MGTFTEPLRRNAVTIGLSLLLALGVAYYVLAYLPIREEYLRARYFRVVERIGVNMQEKTRAFGKRGEAMAMQIRYEAYQAADYSTKHKFSGVSNKLYVKTANDLDQRWRAGALNAPEFDSLARPGGGRPGGCWPCAGRPWCSAYSSSTASRSRCGSLPAPPPGPSCRICCAPTRSSTSWCWDPKARFSSAPATMQCRPGPCSAPGPRPQPGGSKLSGLG